METVPINERQRFENLLLGQAKRYGLTPKEYLSKVWYHEEAAKIGEYVAMTLLEQLLQLAPMDDEEVEGDIEEGVFQRKTS